MEVYPVELPLIPRGKDKPTLYNYCRVHAIEGTTVQVFHMASATTLIVPREALIRIPAPSQDQEDEDIAYA